ncbi:MAG: hypothetical protein PVH74_17395 [Desulfobacterales bacterium]|jgi:uncharacterized membrane protein affecting hemolysin expression
MDSIRQFGFRLNWRYVILGVVIWWVVMLAVYSILSLRINHLQHRLKTAGIELTNEFAKLAGLPLLEKDSQSIHKLLTEAANRPGVIYASVVDHRNKVVAFTGAGHLMPDMTTTARSVNNVSIQEGGFASHARIVNFVSDITYAGTKIGEIFIGLATPKAIQTGKLFMIFAVASGLLLLALVILFRFQSIKASVTKILQFSPPAAKIETNAKAVSVTCPLCGTRKPLSKTVFKQSNMDALLTGETTKQHADVSGVADNPAKDMPHQLKNEDLSWLKRQIIVRCTEIIKRLTV